MAAQKGEVNTPDLLNAMAGAIMELRRSRDEMSENVKALASMGRGGGGGDATTRAEISSLSQAVASMQAKVNTLEGKKPAGASGNEDAINKVQMELGKLESAYLNDLLETKKWVKSLFAEHAETIQEEIHRATEEGPSKGLIDDLAAMREDLEDHVHSTETAMIELRADVDSAANKRGGSGGAGASADIEAVTHEWEDMKARLEEAIADARAESKALEMKVAATVARCDESVSRMQFASSLSQPGLSPTSPSSPAGGAGEQRVPWAAKAAMLTKELEKVKKDMEGNTSSMSRLKQDMADVRRDVEGIGEFVQESRVTMEAKQKLTGADVAAARKDVAESRDQVNKLSTAMDDMVTMYERAQAEHQAAVSELSKSRSQRQEHLTSPAPDDSRDHEIDNLHAAVSELAVSINRLQENDEARAAAMDRIPVIEARIKELNNKMPPSLGLAVTMPPTADVASPASRDPHPTTPQRGAGTPTTAAADTAALAAAVASIELLKSNLDAAQAQWQKERQALASRLQEVEAGRTDIGSPLTPASHDSGFDAATLARVPAIERAVGHMDQSVSTLEMQVTELTERLAIAEQQAARADAAARDAAARLDAKLDSMAAGPSRASSVVTTVEGGLAGGVSGARITSLEEQVEQFRSGLARVQQALKDSAHGDAVEEVRARLAASIGEIDSRVRRTTAAAEEDREAAQALRERVQQLSKTLQGTNNEISSLKLRVEEVSVASEWRVALGSLERKVNASHDAAEEAARTVEARLVELGNKQVQTTAAQQDRIAALREDITRVERLASRAAPAASTAASSGPTTDSLRLSSFEDQISGLEQRMHALEEGVGEMASSSADTDSRLQTIASQLNAISAMNSPKPSRAAEPRGVDVDARMETAMKPLTSMVVAVQRALDAQEARLDAVTRDCHSLGDELASLGDIHAAVEVLERRLGETDTRVANNNAAHSKALAAVQTTQQLQQVVAQLPVPSPPASGPVLDPAVSTTALALAPHVNALIQLAADAPRLQSAVSDAARTSGEATRAAADASRAASEASRVASEASRVAGEANRTAGDASRAAGSASTEAGRAAADASRAAAGLTRVEQTAADAQAAASRVSGLEPHVGRLVGLAQRGTDLLGVVDNLPIQLGATMARITQLESDSIELRQRINTVAQQQSASPVIPSSAVPPQVIAQPALPPPSPGPSRGDASRDDTIRELGERCTRLSQRLEAVLTGMEGRVDSAEDRCKKLERGVRDLDDRMRTTATNHSSLAAEVDARFRTHGASVDELKNVVAEQGRLPAQVDAVQMRLVDSRMQPYNERVTAAEKAARDALTRAETAARATEDGSRELTTRMTRLEAQIEAAAAASIASSAAAARLRVTDDRPVGVTAEDLAVYKAQVEKRLAEIATQQHSADAAVRGELSALQGAVARQSQLTALNEGQDKLAADVRMCVHEARGVGDRVGRVEAALAALPDRIRSDESVLGVARDLARLGERVNDVAQTASKVAVLSDKYDHMRDRVDAMAASRAEMQREREQSPIVVRRSVETEQPLYDPTIGSRVRGLESLVQTLQTRIDTNTGREVLASKDALAGKLEARLHTLEERVAGDFRTLRASQDEQSRATGELTVAVQACQDHLDHVINLTALEHTQSIANMTVPAALYAAGAPTDASVHSEQRLDAAEARLSDCERSLEALTTTCADMAARVGAIGVGPHLEARIETLEDAVTQHTAPQQEALASRMDEMAQATVEQVDGLRTQMEAWRAAVDRQHSEFEARMEALESAAIISLERNEKDETQARTDRAEMMSPIPATPPVHFSSPITTPAPRQVAQHSDGASRTEMQQATRAVEALRQECASLWSHVEEMAGAHATASEVDGLRARIVQLEEDAVIAGATRADPAAPTPLDVPQLVSDFVTLKVGRREFEALRGQVDALMTRTLTGGPITSGAATSGAATTELASLRAEYTAAVSSLRGEMAALQTSASGWASLHTQVATLAARVEDTRFREAEPRGRSPTPEPEPARRGAAWENVSTGDGAVRDLDREVVRLRRAVATSVSSAQLDAAVRELHGELARLAANHRSLEGALREHAQSRLAHGPAVEILGTISGGSAVAAGAARVAREDLALIHTQVNDQVERVSARVANLEDTLIAVCRSGAMDDLARVAASDSRPAAAARAEAYLGAPQRSSAPPRSRDEIPSRDGPTGGAPTSYAPGGAPYYSTFTVPSRDPDASVASSASAAADVAGLREEIVALKRAAATLAKSTRIDTLALKDELARLKLAQSNMRSAASNRPATAQQDRSPPSNDELKSLRRDVGKLQRQLTALQDARPAELATLQHGVAAVQDAIGAQPPRVVQTGDSGWYKAVTGLEEATLENFKTLRAEIQAYKEADQQTAAVLTVRVNRLVHESEALAQLVATLEQSVHARTGDGAIEQVVRPVRDALNEAINEWRGQAENLRTGALADGGRSTDRDVFMSRRIDALQREVQGLTERMSAVDLDYARVTARVDESRESLERSVARVTRQSEAAQQQCSQWLADLRQELRTGTVELRTITRDGVGDVRHLEENLSQVARTCLEINNANNVLLTDVSQLKTRLDREIELRQALFLAQHELQGEIGALRLSALGRPRPIESLPVITLPSAADVARDETTQAELGRVKSELEGLRGELLQLASGATGAIQLLDQKMQSVWNLLNRDRP